jgi:hypothetical protein
MIELVSETRCILSNKCVQVCPVNVSHPSKGHAARYRPQGQPHRPASCASYIARPTRSASRHRPKASAVVGEPAVIANGLLGNYRERAWAAPAKITGKQSFRPFERH